MLNVMSQFLSSIIIADNAYTVEDQESQPIYQGRNRIHNTSAMKYSLVASFARVVAISLIIPLRHINGQKNSTAEIATITGHPHERRRRRSNALTYVCPNAVGDSNSTSVPSGTSIVLEKAKSGQLCTLTLVTITDGESSVPVGRSYNGHDWQRVAGPFPSLAYSCNSNSDYCNVATPIVASSNQELRLTTFTRDLPKKDEVARFLEQVTFGTTREDLDSLNTSTDESTDLMPRFVDWIKGQYYHTDPTSHRAYYRKLVTAVYSIPGREGLQSNPCGWGSRWRSYAFTRNDKAKRVLITKVGNRYTLGFIGVGPRTSVENIEFVSGTEFTYTGPASLYKVCGTSEHLYGYFAIIYKGNCESIKGGNPEISFEGITSEPEYIIDLDTNNSFTKMASRSNDKVELLIRTQMIDNFCDSIPYPASMLYNIYARLPNGQLMLFEPTVIWQENTVWSPAEDGGGGVVTATNEVAQCVNTPRTFLNEAGCKLSNSVDACVSYGSLDSLHLTKTNLRYFYQILQIPVYAVTHLRLEDDYTVKTPCTSGERSRWRKTDDCVENVETSTSALFGSFLLKDDNPSFRDVIVPVENERQCHENDLNKRYITVKVEGQCWKNIHPENFSVYNFKEWASKHPGNTPTQNFIENFAINGRHMLRFPSSHPMTRWIDNKGSLEYIGKFGDIISVEGKRISGSINEEAAKALGLWKPKFEGRHSVVCGSPNEIANDVLSVPYFKISQRSGYNLKGQKRTVWTMIALNAKDQLRQRVAW